MVVMKSVCVGGARITPGMHIQQNVLWKSRDHPSLHIQIVMTRTPKTKLIWCITEQAHSRTATLYKTAVGQDFQIFLLYLLTERLRECSSDSRL